MGGRGVLLVGKGLVFFMSRGRGFVLRMIYECGRGLMWYMSGGGVLWDIWEEEGFSDMSRGGV